MLLSYLLCSYFAIYCERIAPEQYRMKSRMPAAKMALIAQISLAKQARSEPPINIQKSLLLWFSFIGCVKNL